MPTRSSFFGATQTLGIAPQMVPGQVFRNVPIPNFRPAIYQLAIRAPQPPNALVQLYTFPLSPQAVRKEFTSLAAIYDVAGPPQTYGVERVVDMYGITPVTFLIAGTTGWQFHSTDGATFTGLQSIRVLENVLLQYAQLNQQQLLNQQPDMFVLEFYDFFRGDYWQVVPVGPQGLIQNAQRPLYVNYQFRLVGIRDVKFPVPQSIDVILEGFALTFSQAAENIVAFANNISTSYSGQTFITPV